MPSSTARKNRLTVPQLHRYMGFRKPRDWTEILDLSQENVELVVDDGVAPLELGDVANIKRSRHNKTPIASPAKFLEAVYMDIGYGDCKAIGGAKYCILLVDRANHYAWINALKPLTHEDITNAFRDFQLDAGALPTRIYTDFDSKLIQHGPTGNWLQDSGCKVVSPPGGCQCQNGLVERTWQTTASHPWVVLTLLICKCRKHTGIGLYIKQYMSLTIFLA